MASTYALPYTHLPPSPTAKPNTAPQLTRPTTVSQLNSPTDSHALTCAPAARESVGGAHARSHATTASRVCVYHYRVRGLWKTNVGGSHTCTLPHASPRTVHFRRMKKTSSTMDEVREPGTTCTHKRIPYCNAEIDTGQRPTVIMECPDSFRHAVSYTLRRVSECVCVCVCVIICDTSTGTPET